MNLKMLIDKGYVKTTSDEEKIRLEFVARPLETIGDMVFVGDKISNYDFTNAPNINGTIFVSDEKIVELTIRKLDQKEGECNLTIFSCDKLEKLIFEGECNYSVLKLINIPNLCALGFGETCINKITIESIFKSREITYRGKCEIKKEIAQLNDNNFSESTMIKGSITL